MSKYIEHTPIRKISLWVMITIQFVLLSCQEVYENEDLDANKQIPVVHARLSNTPGPHFVELGYARPYNQDISVSIDGATVKVIDGDGREFFYEERSNGYYQMERDVLTAAIGQTYTLHIQLPDGKILQSQPQTMPDSIGVQRVSAALTTQEETYTDNSGQVHTQNTEGYAYSITVRETDRPEAFYRLKSDFYVYATYSDVNEETINYPDESGDSLISATRYQTNYYDCYTYFTDRHQLPVVGRLSANLDLNVDERSRQTQFLLNDFSHYTSDNFIEWIVMADVYAITEQTYHYYRDLNEQLTAPERIYDPIPTQLTGNMHCVTDTIEKVLGHFEVSARSRRYNALYKYESFGNVSILSRFYPDTTRYSDGCHIDRVSVDTIQQEINVIDE